MSERTQVWVYIPPTGFHSESVRVICCHHISGPDTKIAAPLMIKDKAEAWTENQSPSFFIMRKTHTARHFHSNRNILHTFYRSKGIWVSHIWHRRIFHFMFQTILLSLSLFLSLHSPSLFSPLWLPTIFPY